MRFKYNTYHVPTNTFLEAEGDFFTEEDFLRHLNKWNKDGRGFYIYTSVDPIQPKGVHTVLGNAHLVLPPPNYINLKELIKYPDELVDCVGEGC